MLNGFLVQMLDGTLVTIELAICSAVLGTIIGLLGALFESIPIPFIRYPIMSIIFFIRGLPELLVLFFMYFGVAALLSRIFGSYVDISPFLAGVIALGLIFGAYASQVFHGAFSAVDHGQLDAGLAMGFTRWQVFTRIQIPQAWRHAIPGLGNLWLGLIKDTAIDTLIGLTDLMTQAKIAATATYQPFTFYLFAALIYLVITSISQKIIDFFTLRANRYVH